MKHSLCSKQCAASTAAALIVQLVWGGCSEPEPPVETRSKPPVFAVKTGTGIARSWVYSQGNTRAVRSQILTFEHDGKIVYIRKNPDGSQLKVGDTVFGPTSDDPNAKGELLATLDNRELAAQIASAEASLRQTRASQRSASSDLSRATAELELAETNLNRTTALKNSGAATQADLDASRNRFSTAQAAVEAARAGLSSTRAGTEAQEASIVKSRVSLEKSSIFAPFDGIIAFLNVEVGDYYSATSIHTKPWEEQLRGAPIVVIDPSQFEITVDIPAFDSKAVKPGQEVFVVQGENINKIIRKEVRPKDVNRSFAVPAKVFSVSPSIHPGDRATQVKIRTVPGPNDLRDGEFVTCWIVTAEHENAIVAPFDGIIQEEDEVYGFVLDSGHVARKRTFATGIVDLNGIEITKGLGAGELLVTKGRKGLSNGTAVDLVQSKPVETFQLAPETEVSEARPLSAGGDGEETDNPERGSR